ncbi:CehA/McbA family metallohydrolase [Virgisporangium ochraceum]
MSANDGFAPPPGPAAVIRWGMRRIGGRPADAGQLTHVVRHTAADGAGITTFTGRSPFGIDQWVYLPFEVPAGTRRITVAAAHQRFTAVPWVARNVLDLGLFGPDADLRGWSGGARLRFTVSAGDATPGYVPGPVPPGTWAVALGPVVMNPAGMPWKVRVRVERGDDPAPQAATGPLPTAVAGRGPGWYRGDMHVHTVHSDGHRTVRELIGDARDAGLDFIASTDHNTVSANRHLGGLDLAGLLVIPGTEVTTRHGHWLAVGLPDGQWMDWRYRPVDAVFPAVAARLRAAGGVVVAAHPKVPVPGAAWEFGYDDVDAVEVWNGRWSLDDRASLWMWDRLLRQGRRLVAVGNSDCHTLVDAVGSPHTVVHATGLSARAVLDGVRAGRSYLATSPGISLSLVARSRGRGAAIGGTLHTRGDIEVTATVRGAPWTVLRLHTARGVVARTLVDHRGRCRLVWRGDAPADRFARVEVRRCRPGRAMVAMSNPVWFVA